MKRLFLLLFFLSSLINAQVMNVFWDLDGDKVADETYTVSNGDTIYARLMFTRDETSSVTTGYPISAFWLPINYGYYTRWSSNRYYSNILTYNATLSTVDSTALVLDSASVSYTRLVNPEVKRILVSYSNTDIDGIDSDTALVTFAFVVSGTGSQTLHFEIFGEDNYNMYHQVAVLDGKYKPFAIRAKDCVITSQ